LNNSIAAKAEITRFQTSLEGMFQKIGAASVRFERAIRTKGSRDHMQIHFIPIPMVAMDSQRAFAAFLQRASIHKLKFHEIQVGGYSDITSNDGDYDDDDS
jgi:hypothetical protein